MTARTEPRMPAVERLTFALADCYGGGASAMFGFLYFFFLTDLMGLGPGLAGVVIGVGKVWDACSKPLIGQLSDRTRTRWGRRRPFLLLGAPLILFALPALYAPIGGWDSQWGKAAYAVVTLLIYFTVNTLVTTPYASLSTETTTDLLQRNRLNLLRMACSMIATAILTVSMIAIVDAVRRHRMSTAALFAVVCGIAVIFAALVLTAGLVVRERVPLPTHPPARVSVQCFLQPLRVPEFRALLGLYLCQALTMDVISQLLLAFTTHVTRINANVFAVVLMLVNLVAVGVIAVVVKKTSKGVIYGRLLPLAIVGGLLFVLWPSSWGSWMGYVWGLILVIGIAGAAQISWVMFPDVVDAGELATGERQAGAFTGMMQFCRSIGQALVVFLVGLSLQVSGYVPAVAGKEQVQPASAVWGIRLTMAAAFVIFLSIGWWLAQRYRLTPEICLRNKEDLALRRQEGA